MFHRHTSTTKIFLLILLGLAFALRIYRLEASGFWFDETASYFIAAKGPVELVRYILGAPGEHPPGYYLLLTCWMRVAGASEFALRFFSAWFGVLFVALFHRFARHHFDKPVAFTATLISVAFPFLIIYSQETRMYTLVLCPIVLAMDYFLRWARGERFAAHKYLLFFSLALSIHYYSALLMAAHDIYLLSRRELWRAMGRLTLLWHLAALALLGGWFFFARGNLNFANRAFTNPLFAGHSLSGLAHMTIDLTVGSVVVRSFAVAEYWLTAGTLVLLLMAIRRLPFLLSPSTRGWTIATVIVPPLLAAIVPYVYAGRYLFVIMPGLMLLLAAGLLALRSLSRVGFIAGSVVLALTIVYGLNLNYHFVKSPYREMARAFLQNSRPTDGLILDGVGQWPLVLYYLRDPGRGRYIPADRDLAELSDIDADMRKMQQNYDRLWVIGEQTAVMDPGDNVARWLSLNAFPVWRQWFGHDSVALFVTGQRLTPTPHHNLQFGEWLMLERAALSMHTVVAGEALGVQLSWHALKPIPQRQQLLMTLRLFDASGQMVQERVTKPCDGYCAIDDWIPGESKDDRHGLLVPAHLPVGDYKLRLEVFAPRQQQSLLIVDGVRPLGNSLELASIQIIPKPIITPRVFIPLLVR